jgi:hypothetical protein
MQGYLDSASKSHSFLIVFFIVVHLGNDPIMGVVHLDNDPILSSDHRFW